VRTITLKRDAQMILSDVVAKLMCDHILLKAMTRLEKEGVKHIVIRCEPDSSEHREPRRRGDLNSPH